MIEFKLDGNWPGVLVALRGLPVSLQAAAVWGQRKVAEGLVKKVKDHLKNQDLNWPERSEQYNAGDPRILIDTEAYFRAIQAFKQGTTYYAGVKDNKYNAKGDRIVDYALMNELGGGNLPPRPLWGPSINEMGGAKGVKAIVVAAIFAKVSRLRALGFNVSVGKI